MKGPRASCNRYFRPASGRLAATALALTLLFLGGVTVRAEPAGAEPAGTETAGAPCDESAPETIQVTVEKVRSSKGLITAVLYSDNPETFLKRGARLDRIRVDAREGETTLCLHAPAAGRYSVALYHDENGNKEFDRDFLGIPSEGYGFSQNPGFRFGKPDVEETLFAIDGAPVSLRIAMLYLH